MSIHCICKISQRSSGFQTQIQPQRPERISNAFYKADIENLFEHGEVINYTSDGVSIHTVITKIQASFLTQLPERKETPQGFHHEANGGFKTVTEFNNILVIHNTNVIDIVKRRKPVQNTNIPKQASCLQQGAKVILQKMWQSN